MTFDELHGEYMKICNNIQDCVECEYYNKYPCQLAFGYDKGRTDAINEFMNKLPYSAMVRMSTIKEIAEQLKKGN